MNDGVDILVVPDVSAAELIKLAKSSGMSVDPDLVGWDFYRGVDGEPISGRGKRFEVLNWQPRQRVEPDEVRAYAKRREFYGHVGASITFFVQRNPRGLFASIPDGNACLRSFGASFVPFYDCVVRERALGLKLLKPSQPDFGYFWTFLAFRELS